MASGVERRRGVESTVIDSEAVAVSCIGENRVNCGGYGGTKIECISNVFK